MCNNGVGCVVGSDGSGDGNGGVGVDDIEAKWLNDRLGYWR